MLCLRYRRLLQICCTHILGDPGADSGGKGKSKPEEKKWREENGEKGEKGLFSPFFTFLRAIFFSARLLFPLPPLSAPGSPRMLHTRKTSASRSA